MSETPSSLLATQSNTLVEARYALSVGEQRMILAMTALIQPEDQDFKTYTIEIKKLGEILRIDSKNAYREFDKITDRLMKRVLVLRHKEGTFTKLHWVSVARQKKSSVELEFHPEMKPYLLQLKEQFTCVKLSIVTQFKSIYTIRIYTLLKQYENIGFREFELSDFRAILAIPDHEYKQFNDFRKRVLNQAKKEFECKSLKPNPYKSDITFDLITKKIGRRISHLRFIIKKQATPDSDSPGSASPILEAESMSPDLIKQLINHGIHSALATQFMQEKGPDAVTEALQLYEAKLSAGKVHDISGGYLAELIRREAVHQPPAQKQAETERQRKVVQQQVQQVRLQQQAEQKRVNSAAQKERFSQIMAGLDAAAVQRLIQAFEDSSLFANMNAFEQGQYRTRGTAFPAVQLQFQRFVLTESGPITDRVDD